MITIGYITSRPEPRFDWFFESLAKQLKPEDQIEIVIVDFYAEPNDDWLQRDVSFRQIQTLALANKIFRKPQIEVAHCPPKPTVWAGPDRLTKDNWWAAANARNTVLALARGDYWAQVDDRCVLLPGWMEAVREACAGNYSICGPYQKRTGITVQDGAIRHGGIVTGEDNRLQYVREFWDERMNPHSCPGEWWYGCSTCLPVEWALKVNGYDETADSSSGEDYIFGLMLKNNGFEIRFDTRMAIIEDRTPEFLGPPMHRKDKGQSPDDKSHALLKKLRGLKRAAHPWDMRQIQAVAQRDGFFPKANWPMSDWYDGEPLVTMKP